jgi:hypothetical protein
VSNSLAAADNILILVWSIADLSFFNLAFPNPDQSGVSVYAKFSTKKDRHVLCSTMFSSIPSAFLCACNFPSWQYFPLAMAGQKNKTPGFSAFRRKMGVSQ